MTDKYQNKYRIPSARLQNWDYRWAGAYFITICTQNRAHYFGEIENGDMKLSSVGTIADVLWHEIKNHAKNIELDAFVVMPNHVRGILILNGDNFENTNDTCTMENEGNGGKMNNGYDTENGGNMGIVDDGDNVGNGDNMGNGGNVETGHALSLQPIQPIKPIQPSEKTIGQNRFQNIGINSISSIIGSYKSAVTKHAHRLGFDFKWQTRFHDHIIRDNKSFETIQTYIIENPINWVDDKFYN